MTQEKKVGEKTSAGNNGEIKIIPIKVAESTAELIEETPDMRDYLQILQEMENDSRSWSTGQIQIPSTLIGR